MPSAAILFDGSKSSTSQIERSFEWAKNASGSLLAVYLVGAAAAICEPVNLTANSSSSTGFLQLVVSQINALRQRARAEAIPLDILVIKEPLPCRLGNRFEECEMLFLSTHNNLSGLDKYINLEHWSAEGTVCLRKNYC